MNEKNLSVPLEFISNSPNETENIAAELAKKLAPGSVIAFTGGLGAGKTAFVRGLAVGLGIDDDVSSPTFALVHEYKGKKASLYHFDMYRVESWDSLYSTGFFDYLDMGGFLAVEWSENISAALPENTIFVSIEVLDENIRRITVTGGDNTEYSGC